LGHASRCLNADTRPRRCHALPDVDPHGGGHQFSAGPVPHRAGPSANTANGSMPVVLADTGTRPLLVHRRVVVVAAPGLPGVGGAAPDAGFADPEGLALGPWHQPAPRGAPRGVHLREALDRGRLCSCGHQDLPGPLPGPDLLPLRSIPSPPTLPDYDSGVRSPSFTSPVPSARAWGNPFTSLPVPVAQATHSGRRETHERP